MEREEGWGGRLVRSWLLRLSDVGTQKGDEDDCTTTLEDLFNCMNS